MRLLVFAVIYRNKKTCKCAIYRKMHNSYMSSYKIHYINPISMERYEKRVKLHLKLQVICSNSAFLA